MATMIEKQTAAARAKVEKLENRLAKLETQLAKREEKCRKLYCLWTGEEWFERRLSGNYTSTQNDAHWDLVSTQNSIEECNHDLQIKRNKLAELEGKQAAMLQAQDEQEQVHQLAQSWIKAPADTAAGCAEWREQFRAACAADGVQMDEIHAAWMTGETKSGKRFCLYLNSGATKRSTHCYGLRIGGRTIFTSGDFTTCYAELRK